MRYVLDAPDLVIGGLSIDPILAFGGLLAGLLVGLTGMGGAALVTPMLVLVFGVPPAAAVSSDVVASAAMKANPGCEVLYLICICASTALEMSRLIRYLKPSL